MTLLQPSDCLGKARKTRKQILKDAQLESMLQGLHKPANSGEQPVSSPSQVSHLVGTTWGSGRRKNRKRRRLKAEKLLLDPKHVHPKESSPSSVSVSDLESVGDEDDENDPENKDSEGLFHLLLVKGALPRVHYGKSRVYLLHMCR